MRLLIIRPESECRPIKGHETVCLPLIEIVPPKDGGKALQKALAQAETFDWVVFTSQNAVRAVRRYRRKLPGKLKVAAVGPQTAQALRPLTQKVFVPCCPHGAKGLLKFFRAQKMKGAHVLYPRSSIGRKELTAGLREMGAKVTAVAAYQTRPTGVSPARLRKTLDAGIDAVWFHSPSAEKSFFSKISRRDPLLKKINLVKVFPE